MTARETTIRNEGGFLLGRTGGVEMEKTTMNVRELSIELGISLPKAYELTKTPGFPAIRVGTRILIPVAAYHEWLVIQSNKDVK